ncbi:MAG: PAS domain S-box protein, partial [Thermoplasmata archaeon]
PDYREESKKFGMKRLKGEDVPNNFETAIITKDDDVKYIEITVSSIYYKGQKANMGTARDITEKKEKENKIKFQADLLDRIEHAVIATDIEGQIIYWNHHAEELYEWKSDELLGKNIIDVTPSLIEKEKAKEIMDKLNNDEKWSGEFEVKNKDDEEFTVHVTDSPLYDDTGEIKGIVGVSYNITDKKQAREKLKKEKQRTSGHSR